MNILESKIKLELKYIIVISNFYIYNTGFFCSHSKLTSLYGSPKIVKGSFDCAYNNLTSLKYCPVEVRGNFNCSDNPLESLEHCPKYVTGSFFCYNNPVKFTEEYVRSLCEVKGKIYC